jgi:hypothetical protein
MLNAQECASAFWTVGLNASQGGNPDHLEFLLDFKRGTTTDTAFTLMLKCLFDKS